MRKIGSERSMGSKVTDYIRVINYTKAHGTVTAQELIEKLKIPRSNVYNILKVLERDRMMKKLEKKGKIIVYSLPEYVPYVTIIRQAINKHEAWKRAFESKRAIPAVLFDQIARIENIDTSNSEYVMAVKQIMEGEDLKWAMGDPGRYR